ncbi:MAG: hypothetical protein QXQ94_08335 [Candidatus Bathyarchaeia archaeon]
MLSVIDILSLIEERKNITLKLLAKSFEIPTQRLNKILLDLSKHNLVDYNPKSGTVKLPKWISQINEKFEDIKPATGTIILPESQEIKIQDISIGNYTKEDVELNVRFRGKLKEIAICNLEPET